MHGVECECVCLGMGVYVRRCVNIGVVCVTALVIKAEAGRTGLRPCWRDRVGPLERTRVRAVVTSDFWGQVHVGSGPGMP